MAAPTDAGKLPPMADGAHPRNNKTRSAEKPTRPRTFTRAEYDAMGEAGIFAEGERAELVSGEIFSMAGEGDAHVDGVDSLFEALLGALPPGFVAYARTRLDIGNDTEVYPDVVVVAQPGVRARDRGPATVALIVEVSVSSLHYDRDIKSALYAEAGFAEFWIFEPLARRLWVHRAPKDGTWGLVFKVEGDDAVSPLFAPDAALQLPIIPSDPGNDAGSDSAESPA